MGPSTSAAGEAPFDPAKPFRGVVICCTAIPPDQRHAIGVTTEQLGGRHNYDLTFDVTHLIVGEYDTAKYRHVAQERPDIRLMAVGWVEAVRRLWVADADIDFAALEEKWTLKTFETGGGELDEDGNETPRMRLLCCSSGIEVPEERQRYIDLVIANGGAYSGVLSRDVTHLIVARPEGKKYTWARQWDIPVVSLEWLRDCAARGAILHERYYAPTLPPEERGKGATKFPLGAGKTTGKRDSLGKRTRANEAAGSEHDTATGSAADDGRRKLRRTASNKLGSQRDGIWGDILAQQHPPKAQQPEEQPFGPVRDPSRPIPGDPVLAAAAPINEAAAAGHVAPQPLSTSAAGHPAMNVASEVSVQSVFGNVDFHIHGFSGPQTAVLRDAVRSLGGGIIPTLSGYHVPSESTRKLFVIIPQDTPPATYSEYYRLINSTLSTETGGSAMAADGKPRVPKPEFVTEFYIERCLHLKRYFDPRNHVIGRPFRAFPLPGGFQDLVVSTAGFTGVGLRHVHAAVQQLGAEYAERFTERCDVLIVADQPLPATADDNGGGSSRGDDAKRRARESLKAVRRQKLKLSVTWKVPVVAEAWLWACVKAKTLVPVEDWLFADLGQRGRSDIGLLPGGGGRKGKGAGGDKAEKPQAGTDDTAKFKPVRSHDADASTSVQTFDTALTHQQRRTSASDSSSTSAPLSEVSSNALNKSPSPQKQPQPEPSDTRMDKGKGKAVQAPRQQEERSMSDSDGGKATNAVPDSTDTTPPLTTMSVDGAAPQDSTSRADTGRHSSEKEDTSEEQESAEALARRRVEQRIQAEARAAAERLALASKLSALFDSTKGAGGDGAAARESNSTVESMVLDGDSAANLAQANDAGSLDTAPSVRAITAELAADEEEQNAAQESVASVAVEAAAGGRLLRSSKAVSSPNTTTATTRPRRTRKILGRATSNVSATSSGAPDSGNAAGGEHGQAAAEAAEDSIPDGQAGAVVSIGATTEGTGAGEATAAGAAALPPSTQQIEYVDEDTRRYKDRLLQRAMSGSASGSGSGGGKGTGAAAHLRQLVGEASGDDAGEERLTLADLERARRAQEELDRAQQRRTGRASGGGGVGLGVAERRTSRRKPGF